MRNIRIGIIREGKTPLDMRTPLSPEQVLTLKKRYPQIEVLVQPSNTRCFSNQQYEDLGICLTEDLSDCSILLGVKEVPIDNLLAGKTYLFFSHTTKKQPYNKALLRTILERKIRLIDYEHLVNVSGRVIAFGRYAGVVGAHNILWAYGRHQGAKHTLERAYVLGNFDALQQSYAQYTRPDVRIAVLGGGRVAGGVVELLEIAGFKRLEAQAFLENPKQQGVYTQLNSLDYHVRKDGNQGNYEDFYANPSLYKSTFFPYIPLTNVLISAFYWNPQAPELFSAKQAAASDFAIRYIADITCDIKGSIPSTCRASTIESPIYYYNRQQQTLEETPDGADSICVMAVDNLPNELPQDASMAFGEQLIAEVIPSLLVNAPLIGQATIAQNGQLQAHYRHLNDWVYGSD